MVRLQRGATPYLLQQRGATWTLRWQEIHAVLRTGDWATPAAKKLLFVELRKLAFGKCAFCEGLLEVTSYLGVEHYVAKTVRPEQAFEWTNLFPVCRLCNNSKSDVDHAGMLLKPDTDDPESMFWLHPDSGKLEARPFLALAVRQRVEQTPPGLKPAVKFGDR